LNEGPLLARINAELGGVCHGWSDVLIVKNVGALAATRHLLGDAISNRGFNAYLLGPDHTPTHFLKVRPAGHEGFRREADMTVHLSRHLASKRLVPNARAFVEAPARVLIEEFIDGVVLEAAIRAKGAPAWYDLAAEVLKAVRPIWDITSLASGETLPALVDHMELLADLRVLESIGLDEAVSRRLAERISSERLVAVPQHGDLWPKNVLKAKDGWCVLDFETCGEVKIPLYDVFHFIRGCGEVAGDGRGDWLERWRSSSSKANALTVAVRRAADGMAIASIEAALLAYSVDFAARLHRRGVSRSQTSRRVSELAKLEGLVQEGVVAQLFGPR
jgi:hypothetical protein